MKSSLIDWEVRMDDGKFWMWNEKVPKIDLDYSKVL